MNENWEWIPHISTFLVYCLFWCLSTLRTIFIRTNLQSHSKWMLSNLGIWCVGSLDLYQTPGYSSDVFTWAFTLSANLNRGASCWSWQAFHVIYKRLIRRNSDDPSIHYLRFRPFGTTSPFTLTNAVTLFFLLFFFCFFRTWCILSHLFVMRHMFTSKATKIRKPNYFFLQCA